MHALVRRLGLAWALVLLLPASAWASTSPVIAGSVSDAVNLSATVSVAVSGHYAYTTAYHSGELTAINFATPSAPTIAGESAPFLQTNLIGGSNVAISGGYAFVVSKNRNASTTNNDDGNGNSLTILDIHTNPASPIVVGTIRSTTKLFGSYGIAVSGNYAYVAYQGLLAGQPKSPDTSTGGFSVIDISSLGSPTIVANIDNGSLPAPYTGQNLFDHSTSVAISGQYAYVTAFYGSGHLTTIDISNPTNPQIVGTVSDPVNMSFPVDVVVQGNYAYVADQAGGTSPELTTVDISNPAAPRVAGELSASALNGAYRIRVRGSFAYLSGSGANTISAVDISDPTAPRLAGFVYDATRLRRTTGLDVDSTGAYVVASSPYSPTESNPTYPPYPNSGSGSPTNTGTISVVNLDPVTVSATISAASEPTNPTTQTSANFSFSVNDTVSTVRCSLDGAAYGLCTSATTQQYSGLGSGSHTFSVQAIDSAGHTSTKSYTWTVQAPPANNGALPSISGSPVVGQTLTASPGGWSGSPSFAYQWQQCDSTGANCSAITGATGQTYVVAPGDAGQTLMVVVTGSNASGSSSANSAAVGPVAQAPSNSGAAPSISGTPTVGQTLTASPGGWSGSPAPTFTYQWQQCDSTGANCSAITGATNSTYTAQSGDAGQTLMVVVTGSNASGSSSANSTAVGPVAQAPSNSGAAPSISGTPTVGQTLTASPGGWSGSPAPTFTYQWQQCDSTGANCSAITGASGQTYVVAPGDAGQTLMVVVTGSNASGSAPANSGTVGPVAQASQAPANTGAAPSISGSATVGQTLTASPGGWSGSPAPTFTYQWQQCDSTGANCSAITGASGQTYVVAPGDAGQTLMVVVTGSNASGSVPANSSTVGPVGQAPSNSGAAPSISGTPTVGQTLTASPGGWSGSPAPTFTYQWQQCDSTGANCSAITGATNSTYTVQSGDAGQTLMVVATGSNASGSVPANSGTVGPVTQAPANTGAAPSISGTAKVGQTLTASPGGWSGSPAPTFTYQWRQCNSSGTGCAAITGATAKTYLLRSGDAGHTVIVSVTGTNSVGSAVAASAPSAVVVSPPGNTVAPTISGTGAVGQTLTSTSGTWTGYPTPTLAYQWVRCNSIGEACVFTGGTATTYTITTADVGFTVRLHVRATNSAGTLLIASTTYTGIVPPAGSAAVVGVNSGTPTMLVSVQAGPATTAASQVTIMLPAGMRFAVRHKLLTALKVTGKNGRRLTFRATLRRGALVLSFNKPVSRVTVAITSAGLSVTHALRTKVTSRPGTREKLHLTVRTMAGRLSREALSVKLS